MYTWKILLRTFLPPDFGKHLAANAGNSALKNEPKSTRLSLSFWSDAARTFICDMTRSYVTWLVHMWHDSFICDMSHSCVTWLIHVWHDSLMCDMTHSCVTWLIHVWHDSFICDITHSYVTCLVHVWHDSFICDMSHSYVTCLVHVWHDLFICDMTHLHVTCLIHMWCDSFICDTRLLLSFDSNAARMFLNSCDYFPSFWMFLFVVILQKTYVLWICISASLIFRLSLEMSVFFPPSSFFFARWNSCWFRVTRRM